MRDVVIVGGGLTGLAAAYELAQHDLDCTLIEVNRHLGGSIQSTVKDDCTMDNAAFVIHNNLDTTWLESLGLEDALFTLEEGAIAFKQGSSRLIQALKSNITATRLMRMAVSSIGELENGRYSICMENGLMFDAKSLILAVPARYTERIFYGYITPLTEQLLDYQYDTIQRVSIVCETAKLPKINNLPDMAYVFIHRTEHSARVPEGYTLLQFGIRLDPTRLQSDEQIVEFICKQFALPEPLTTHVAYWSEADPVSCYDDEHTQWVNNLRQQLPEGIALVGSDYSLQAQNLNGVTRLDERIQQGIMAAKQVIATL